MCPKDMKHLQYFYLLLIVCFFSCLFWKDWPFSHVFISAIRAFWILVGVLTFATFVEFLKRCAVKGGRYFLIFQLENMFNLCLNFNESRPIHAYKRYSRKKWGTCKNGALPRKCKWLRPLIPLVHFAVSQNANLIVQKLSKLLHVNNKLSKLSKTDKASTF